MKYRFTGAPFALALMFTGLMGCDAEAPADTRASVDTDRIGKGDSILASSWLFADDEDYAQPTEEEPSADEPAVLEPEVTAPPVVASLTLEGPDSCTNPCTLSARLDNGGNMGRVEFEADGWYLGYALGNDVVSIVYDFSNDGPRKIRAIAYSGDEVIAEASKTLLVEFEAQSCASFESSSSEYAPVQKTGNGAPDGAYALNWLAPSDFVTVAPFHGVPGQKAVHEGTDYIHGNKNVPYVAVKAAAEGQVVYVRSGCPQSALFTPNIQSRECGSGWGNHVVIDHGNHIFTRYAHLAPGSLEVATGQWVQAGDLLGEMGNSGRSELRHLHFELGVSSQGFDPCAPAQSLDTVHDPSSVGL